MVAPSQSSARRPGSARRAGYRPGSATSRNRAPPRRARGLQLTRVWRLAKRGTAAFDGDGARRYGGRWNHPGLPAVYTASHLSLAVLEALVHIPGPEDLPRNLVAIPAHLPDGLAIQRVRVDELPPDWRRTPAPPALADLGTAWLTAARTAVLAVPSAVVPLETNHILNPNHPDFRRIVIGRAEPFDLDSRLGPRGRTSTVIRLPTPRRSGRPR